MTSPRSIFYGPGIWTAWGLQHGGDLDPVALIDRCANVGVKWIACQPPIDTGKLAALRERCHLRGLHFGVWEADPPDFATVDLLHPNFYIANVEHTPGASYGTMLRAFRDKTKHPLLPLALATNFGGFPLHLQDGHPPVCPDAEPWIAANAKIMPEAYQVDQANLTPAEMAFQSRQRGWRLSFPILGCYHDYPLASYDVKVAGVDGFSVYLAEEMQPADWTTLKEMTA